VYAAHAWVSLAPRFASDHSEIVERIEDAIGDPVPAVRLQVAQNLQVISAADPDRMWRIMERLADQESEPEILAVFLNSAMRRFSHSAPERCEVILGLIRRRLYDNFTDSQGLPQLMEAMGGWVVQLYVVQGRELAKTWMEEWADDPVRYHHLLDAYSSSVIADFFCRYYPECDAKDFLKSKRAQNGLIIILRNAIRLANEAYGILVSEAFELDKKYAESQYRAAEEVLYHAINQIYFNSGARAERHEGNTGVGLANNSAKKSFLSDYAEVLSYFACSRQPAVLHYLIELYEFLITADPEEVFGAVYDILLGQGRDSGYHYEGLGNAAVVRIVECYIADFRYVFSVEGNRKKLIAILQLFSEAGWVEALSLLYDLPELLR